MRYLLTCSILRNRLGMIDLCAEENVMQIPIRREK